MNRFEDWPGQLAEEIEKHRGQRFEWGVNDCALFSCACVLAMTGVDIAADFRGRYKTAAGSVRALKKHGGGDLKGTAALKLGDAIEPFMTGRGDMVLVPGAEGEALAIVDLSGVQAVTTGPEGMVFVPMAEWICGWRV